MPHWTEREDRHCASIICTDTSEANGVRSAVTVLSYCAPIRSMTCLRPAIVVSLRCLLVKQLPVVMPAMPDVRESIALPNCERVNPIGKRTSVQLGICAFVPDVDERTQWIVQAREHRVEGLEVLTCVGHATSVLTQRRCQRKRSLPLVSVCAR